MTKVGFWTGLLLFESQILTQKGTCWSIADFVVSMYATKLMWHRYIIENIEIMQILKLEEVMKLQDFVPIINIEVF